MNPNLTLPHPRLFERAFVLIPLAEIAGERVIAGRRVDEAARVVDGGRQSIGCPRDLRGAVIDLASTRWPDCADCAILHP